MDRGTECATSTMSPSVADNPNTLDPKPGLLLTQSDEPIHYERKGDMEKLPRQNWKPRPKVNRNSRSIQYDPLAPEPLVFLRTDSAPALLDYICIYVPTDERDLLLPPSPMNRSFYRSHGGGNIDASFTLYLHR